MITHLRHWWNSPARPGRLSHRTHTGILLLLLVLIAVDYVLLSQSLILLNSSLSEERSVTTEMYFVALGFSAMVVALPHVAAILLRRITDGLAHRTWLVAVGGAVVFWVAILVLVTTMRITAAARAEQAATAEGLFGGATQSPGLDPLHPEVLMAVLTAFFLTITGVISFVTAWMSYRPLLTAVERGDSAVQSARARLDASVDAQVIAEGVLESARELEPRDHDRLLAARSIVTERLAQLRSEIATLIAMNDGSPESTSRMLTALGELSSRRPLTTSSASHTAVETS